MNSRKTSAVGHNGTRTRVAEQPSMFMYLENAVWLGMSPQHVHFPALLGSNRILGARYQAACEMLHT
jgi:hypothetical protein